MVLPSSANATQHRTLPGVRSRSRAADVVGRVVELDPAAPGSGYRALAAAAAGSEPTIDSVLSLGAISAAAEAENGLGPQDLLGLIAEALAPGGRLVFVEPTRAPTRFGVLSPLRSRGRSAAAIDTPVVIRAAGFTITNLERTRGGSDGWFVDGIAQKTVELRPTDQS